MTDPAFFPIAVFFGKPEHAAVLASIGVNMYQGAEHDGSTLKSITDLGVLVLAQAEWGIDEIGDNPRVVGYHVSDECDMGYSGCENGSEGDAGEQFALAQQRSYVDAFRQREDGRFLQANFGNGVLKTFWAVDTMDDHVALFDVVAVDKYAYTSPHIWSIIDGIHHAPDWPSGAPVPRAYAYGWLTDSMRSFMDPARLTPIWPFIETAMPYLYEEGALTITPAQIEGAAWSAILHEARGLSLFQHNNGAVCGNYSLVDCDADRLAAIKEVFDEIHELAPVLNTQSYVHDFGGAADTMLKVHGGYAYVVAGLGFNHQPGAVHFSLPPGVQGSSVTVVGEDRTIDVVDGAFSDNFAEEYSHHVYRISL